MKRVDVKRVALFGTLALAVMACQGDETPTTTQNLQRPGPMALACVGSAPDAGVPKALPLGDCVEDSSGKKNGTLFGLVANTARGDVALFNTELAGEKLVDLDPSSPGFGFIPVGSIPSDLDVTQDGCRAVVVNSGSCDLSVIDVPGIVALAGGTLKNAAGGLVSRVVPFTSSGPLLARPAEAVISPLSDSISECDTKRSYRAFVSYPGCGLVAEIDLRTGRVVQGLKITKDGYQRTDNPSCPAECSTPPVSPTELPDSGTADSGTADSGTADSGTADSGTADAASDLLTDGPRDAGVDSASARDAADDGLADGTSDGNADGMASDGASDASVDSVVADGSASDGAAADSAVDSASAPMSVGGVLPTALAIVPRAGKSPALYISSKGANFISAVDIGFDGTLTNARRIQLEGPLAKTSRLTVSPFSTQLDDSFVYAVAQDLSVRVISVKGEHECDVNVDLQALPEQVPLGDASCFKVGDSKTPARRVGATGPGFELAGRTPVDVTFVKVPVSDDDDPTPDNDATPLVGIFALIAASDGNVFIIDVHDETRITASSTTVARRYIPHRLRNAEAGTEDEVPSIEVSSVTGGGSGGIPVVVTTESPAVADTLLLRAPGQPITSEWNLVYEARMALRISGQLRQQGASLLLDDPGAEFCRAGILGRSETKGRPTRHGDILVLVGCDTDIDCGLNQSCNRIVGQDSSFGLCFDRGREEELFGQCGAFLRGKREFLIRQSSRTQLVVDVLADQQQRVFKQGKSDCTQNDDCDDGYLCALSSRPVPADPTQSLVQGECFRLGCENDDDCDTGHCVQPLDGAAKICAVTPSPVEVGPPCSSDDACRSRTVDRVCDTDRDCDAVSECRFATSNSTQKVCIDRGFSCSTIPAFAGRCVRPSPCFSELQRYEIYAGRSFIISGAHRVRADPQDGQCREDPAQSPALVNRIPIGFPTFPVLLGPQCVNKDGIPDPNPCVSRETGGYVGFEAKAGPEGERDVTENGPSTQVFFANSDIAFRLGTSHLVRLPTTAGGQTEAIAPMPERGLRSVITANSGYSRLVAPGASSISLPARLVRSPGATHVYLVDQGDRTVTGGATRGQVLRYRSRDLALENYVIR
jgi:hypothetical protein